MQQSAIQFALAAVRGTILINGAAAVALLTFIGQYASASDGKFAAVAVSLATSLYWFGLGAFLGVLVAALSYVAQIAFAHEFTKWGEVFRIPAVLAAIGGMLFFYLGLHNAITSFQSVVAN